jgi:tetratricopeptide (TPR) repeat protein
MIEKKRHGTPNDDQQVCAFCEEQPAIEAYKLGDGRTLMVCAACNVRQKERDALESRFHHVLTLPDDQDDEALACLDEILRANRDNDHDRSMARRVAWTRVWILSEAGRYADAEQALNAWAQLGFANVGERLLHARATAENLHAQGRTQEAVQCLEEGLGHAAPPQLPTAFLILEDLVQMSEKLGQPIDPKWQGLAEAGAKEWGFDLPDWKEKGSSLGEAILEMNAAIRAPQDKDDSVKGATQAKEVSDK